MAVGFMRWLQRADTARLPVALTSGGIAVTIGNDVIAPLHCEEFARFAAKSPSRRCQRHTNE